MFETGFNQSIFFLHPMKKGKVVAVFAAFAAIGAFAALSKNKGSAAVPSDNGPAAAVSVVSDAPTPAEDVGPQSDTSVQDAPVANAKTKEFTVNGKNFAFAPAAIDVQTGDHVKITFKDDEGFHDLVIDGIGATQRVNGGEESSLEFTADKKGTFEYYCSVGRHRQFGMHGQLIVE